MAININSALTYNAYQNNAKKTTDKDKKNTLDAQKTQATEKKLSHGEKKLSKAAKELLEKLRATHGDKDFMVADFKHGDKAKDLLAQGTKEFSVVFSSEELEKMAADEDYYKEKMATLDGALRMSEEINAQFGFQRGEFGETEKAVNANGIKINRFGISFNSDGTTTLFAELEKASAKQKNRIVQATSQEELLEKINKIDWDVVEPDAKTTGTKFDLSI